MIYDYAFTVPANTSAGTPYTGKLKLGAGVVHRVEVQFPVGCAGLASGALWHDGHQWLPSNPDGYFSSDGYVIAFDEHYELTQVLNEVTFKAWNIDETYSHKLTVRIGILPREVVSPMEETSSVFKRFLAVFGIGGN